MWFDVVANGWRGMPLFSSQCIAFPRVLGCPLSGVWGCPTLLLILIPIYSLSSMPYEDY